MFREEAIVFDCEGEELIGILHHPETPPQHGIMMIVGGPQYRIGSHRQFVEFARSQSKMGRAVMRFDYRGMGDSTGPYLNFEAVRQDLLAAMQEFFEHVPSMTTMTWFGLCDAASSSLMHVPRDDRVQGMVLLNPWVRNAQTQAQAVVKHYYGRRLLSLEFWKKVFSGQADVWGSLRSFRSNWKQSRTVSTQVQQDFRSRMLAGARDFDGNILLILSGNDLTANEFQQLVKQSPEWASITKGPNWCWQYLPDANHTFSSSDAKQQVIKLCNDWLQDS